MLLSRAEVDDVPGLTWPHSSFCRSISTTANHRTETFRKDGRTGNFWKNGNFRTDGEISDGWESSDGKIRTEVFRTINVRTKIFWTDGRRTEIFWTGEKFRTINLLTKHGPTKKVPTIIFRTNKI